MIGHVGFEKELDIREFAQSDMEVVVGTGEYNLQGVIVRKNNKVDGTYLAYVRPFHSHSCLFF